MLGQRDAKESSSSTIKPTDSLAAARSSVQPLEISTLVKVEMKSPPMFSLQWATVFVSVHPVSSVG